MCAPCRCGTSAGSRRSCCTPCRPSPLWGASSGAPIVASTSPAAPCCWTTMSMCGTSADPTSLLPALMSTRMWLHVSVGSSVCVHQCVCVCCCLWLCLMEDSGHGQGSHFLFTCFDHLEDMHRCGCRFLRWREWGRKREEWINGQIHHPCVWMFISADP